MLKKLVVVAKHFYHDEHDGRWNFFYQIMGGCFDMKKRKNFTLESTLKEYDGILM
jgi:hypothetical protein